jgi:hypothetical protein
MSIAAGDSSASSATLGDSITRGLRPQAGDSTGVGMSQIWLDGEVLACACPDCGAPMSIRLWLRLAECAMCGARVELGEEFEQLAQQLLERRERGEAVPGGPRGPWSQPVRPRPIAATPGSPQPLPILAPPKAPPPRPAAIPVPPVVPAARSAPVPPPPSPPPASAAPSAPLVAEPVYEVEGEPIAASLVVPVTPIPPPRPAAPAPVSAAAPAGAAASTRVAQPAAAPEAAARKAVPYHSRHGLRRELFRQLIACLVSTVFHTALILILGMIFTAPIKKRPVYLEVDMRLADGGPHGAVIVPKQKDPSAGKQSVSVATAPEAIGRTLTQEIQTRSEPLQLASRLVEAPSAKFLPATGSGSPALGTSLGGRAPDVRMKTLLDEGGSEQTELAVAMGLKWLAKHQNDDGSWSLDGFDRSGDCNGRCDDRGHHSDTAGTALALLPFLGAGHTHRQGEYKETVERGLQWLIRHRDEQYGLMGEGSGRMYAHGQAAIALCEAYALTRDSKLRGPAQQAIDFIVAAQHPAGGWRYFPGEPGDMSVVGWQLMALRSAQMSDLQVPKEVIERSNHFLDSVQLNAKVCRFAYLPGGEPSETMTAEGMLCRLYAGMPTDTPALTSAADFLLLRYPPSVSKGNMYYWYYCSQVMHHLGGSRWKRWNDKMRPLLLSTQIVQGHETGSWNPHNYPDTSGGRVYMTALAVCTLEVYYRHLPLYKNAALVK